MERKQIYEKRISIVVFTDENPDYASFSFYYSYSMFVDGLKRNVLWNRVMNYSTFHHSQLNICMARQMKRFSQQNLQSSYRCSPYLIKIHFILENENTIGWSLYLFWVFIQRVCWTQVLRGWFPKITNTTIKSELFHYP